jgi:hypothetical protein
VLLLSKLSKIFQRFFRRPIFDWECKGRRFWLFSKIIFKNFFSENHFKPFEELPLFSKRVANIGRVFHSLQKIVPQSYAHRRKCRQGAGKKWKVKAGKWKVS